jgi:hypothetical protein
MLAMLAIGAVQGEYAGFNVDDAFYLLRADHFYGRLGDAAALGEAMLQWRPYPPLYPLVLGAFGGGSEAIAMAFVANVLCIGAWMAIFGCWTNRLGVPRGGGALLMLAAVLAPFTLRHAQSLWSEHLYLAFTLGAIALSERGLEPARNAAGVAVLVVLAVLTRTAGFALLAAFAVVLAARRPRGWWIALLAASVPVVAERLLNPGRGYSNALLDPGAASDVAMALPSTLAALAGAWTADWSFQGLGALSAALAGMAAVGWAMRLRQLRLDALYVAAYLVEIVIWPYPEQFARMLYPLGPLCVYYIWLAGDRAFARLPGVRHGASIAAMLVVVLVAVPSIGRLAQRYATLPPPELMAYARTRIWLTGEPIEDRVRIAALRQQVIRDMDAVERLVPVDACVHADLPWAVWVYAHRMGIEVPHPERDLPARLGASVCPYYYAMPVYENGPIDLAGPAAAGHEVLHVSPSVTAGDETPTGVLIRTAQAPATGAHRRPDEPAP